MRKILVYVTGGNGGGLVDLNFVAGNLIAVVMAVAPDKVATIRGDITLNRGLLLLVMFFWVHEGVLPGNRTTVAVARLHR
jgi:hypothetical protein